MSDTRINIRGVGFDNVTLAEAADFLRRRAGEGVCGSAVFTPNSEIVQMCIEDAALCATVNSAALVIPDGIGVVKAARILGTPLKGKVAGVELGREVLAFAAEDGLPVYFLGGKPGVAEAAAEKMREAYPALQICGMHDGYFQKSGEENDAVLNLINESGAKILFVCLGAPAQEKWIAQNKDRLPGVQILMGLGGSLDVYAGTVKRAPKIFIKLGLEWLYRLLKEPRRIGRMMSLPKFYFGTWRYKLAGKK
ncbi:MAG: WecB/TagA/CpsF family glycosyltransferase [Ruminococcaceae bacterium]|nr:WecB/TagA/CpsF family glycosyltransferase [Oscillospiraceae bacterium]